MRVGISAALGLRSGLGYAFRVVFPSELLRLKSVGNTGSAAVEFAICVSMLVVLAIGATDYANMANLQDALEAATRAGAEYARANYTTDAPNWTTTKSQVTGYMTFSPALKAFDCASGDSCVSAVCTCADGSSPTPNSCAGTCSVGSPADTRVFEYVKVTATQTFSPLMSYASFAFPGSLSATTVARVQ